MGNGIGNAIICEHSILTCELLMFYEDDLVLVGLPSEDNEATKSRFNMILNNLINLYLVFF